MSSPVKPEDVQSTIADPSDDLCGSFSRSLLKLPVLMWRFVKWIVDSDGNLTDEFKSALSNALIRPGDLIFSASALDQDGRLLCNGAAVSRTTYADLFEKIGTTYGSGDGSTTFTLPNYQDKFPVGAGGSKAITATGGADTVTLAESNLPPHTHLLAANVMENVDSLTNGNQLAFRRNGGANDDYTFRGVDDAADIGKSGSTGGTAGEAQAFSILPSYVACYIYIKT